MGYKVKTKDGWSEEIDISTSINDLGRRYAGTIGEPITGIQINEANITKIRVQNENGEWFEGLANQPVEANGNIIAFELRGSGYLVSAHFVISSPGAWLAPLTINDGAYSFIISLNLALIDGLWICKK